MTLQDLAAEAVEEQLNRATEVTQESRFRQRAVFDSSNLKEATYTDGIEELHMTFLNGTEYIYYGVPRNVWDALLAAPSSGSYHYHNIRLSYPYNRVR